MRDFGLAALKRGSDAAAIPDRNHRAVRMPINVGEARSNHEARRWRLPDLMYIIIPVKAGVQSNRCVYPADDITWYGSMNAGPRLRRRPCILFHRRYVG